MDNISLNNCKRQLTYIFVSIESIKSVLQLVQCSYCESVKWLIEGEVGQLFPARQVRKADGDYTTVPCT